MYKFVVVFAACLAYASAGVLHPTALAAAPVGVGVAYANAPLYAAGGSSQIDVRHNYDGDLSSYTTTPFGYAGPYSSRYVAGAPAAYAAAPTAFAAPAKYVASAGVVAPFADAASPYVASYASPYAAQYASPYAGQYASPYAGQYTSPYAAQYAAPYASYANAAYANGVVTPFAATAGQVVV